MGAGRGSDGGWGGGNDGMNHEGHEEHEAYEEVAGLPHRWDVSPREAVEVQRRLRGELIRAPPPAAPRYVAGADVSFDRRSPVLHAALVVCRLPGLEVVDRVGAAVEVRFPYVPGLLSFRELPALLAAWEKLSIRPDVLKRIPCQA